MPSIEFKKKEIECNFTYIYNDDLSLVIDIIRHYERIVFRGFVATGDGKHCNFSRLFSFPRGDQLPFSGQDDDGDQVKMDFDGNEIAGRFQGLLPVSFQLSFAIEDAYFSSSKPNWIQRIPLLNNLFKLVRLTRVVSLLHEDFPLVTFNGDVTIGTDAYRLNQARGTIAHHWGWWFPDYIFLMCNGFEDDATLLALGFFNISLRSGGDITGGYMYLRHRGKETRLITPIHGNVIYFREEGKLSVVARFDEGEFVRVNIDPTGGIAFPHVFNTECVTVINTECEVEGIGKSHKAILDVKGFDAIKSILNIEAFDDIK